MKMCLFRVIDITRETEKLHCVPAQHIEVLYQNIAFFHGGGKNTIKTIAWNIHLAPFFWATSTLFFYSFFYIMLIKFRC